MKRSDLHLILMSATVDCDKFSRYFNRCPVVNIPGRTFPVEVSFCLSLSNEESGLKFYKERKKYVLFFFLKGAKLSHNHFKVILISSSPDVLKVASKSLSGLQELSYLC